MLRSPPARSPDSVEIVELTELPMTHMRTSAVQVKVRAVGKLEGRSPLMYTITSDWTCATWPEGQCCSARAAVAIRMSGSSICAINLRRVAGRRSCTASELADDAFVFGRGRGGAHRHH